MKRTLNLEIRQDRVAILGRGIGIGVAVVRASDSEHQELDGVLALTTK